LHSSLARRPAPAERRDDRPPPDVVARAFDAKSLDVPSDCRFGATQVGGDLAGALPLGEELGDRGRGRPLVSQRRARDARDLAVLVAGGVDQRDELVHLEERPGGLRHVDAHPSPTGGIAFDVPVFDRFVEDRSEGREELPDRRGAEGAGHLATLVADVGAGLDRGTELCRFGELLGLERLAGRRVDCVQAVLREERQ
jgi:hypothetical protein